MISEERALELAQAAGSMMGVPSGHDWEGGPVGDLGYCFGPAGLVGAPSLAVTPRGKVATFHRPSQSPESALRDLAKVPDDLVAPAPEEAGSGLVPQAIDRRADGGPLKRVLRRLIRPSQASGPVP